ncbi:19635_t:CDS:2, partial [Gigaspora margarita]
YKAKVNSREFMDIEIVIKKFKKINKEFTNELNTFIKIKTHSNIIQFYGFLSNEPNEPKWNLREYLSKNNTKLNWNIKIKLCKNISCGLLFLHNMNIIHKDLWDKNILINDGVGKICDFGFTKIEEDDNNSNSISFGVVFWKISSSIVLFKVFTSCEGIAIHIYKGNREIPVKNTEKCLFYAIDLGPLFLIVEVIKNILSQEEILSHYFMQKLIINFGSFDLELVEEKIKFNVLT